MQEMWRKKERRESGFCSGKMERHKMGVEGAVWLPHGNEMICTEKCLFLMPLPRRGVGRKGGEWGNAGAPDEKTHGEKSQFGKQRWNHNLWSPLCLWQPQIPTAIKATKTEATGKSNTSHPRTDTRLSTQLYGQMKTTELQHERDSLNHILVVEF